MQTKGHELYYAAFHGDIEQVQALLGAGVDPNFKSTATEENTPLLAAAFNGQEALVGLLLESGANVDSRNSDGATPLYGAAQNGHLAVVRLLLFHRADVNAQRDNGWSPLQIASGNGHVAVVGALLQAGADPDISLDEDHSTPLMAAAEMGQHEVVRLLVANGANLQQSMRGGHLAVHLAAQNGHLAALRALVQAGTNLNALGTGGTPLHFAVKTGHREAVHWLLSQPELDVNVVRLDGHTALDLALQRGDEPLVELLLKHGAQRGRLPWGRYLAICAFLVALLSVCSTCQCPPSVRKSAPRSVARWPGRRSKQRSS